MRISSKREFYQLWEAGALGNRPHLFRDPAEAYSSGFPLIGFRELGKAGGGKWQRVGHMDVLETARIWSEAGRSFIMDSSTYPCDDSNITLQGEVCRTYRGLQGYLGYCKGFTMRAAMREGLLKHRSSSEVLVMLERWMDPSSIDDVRDLLDMYPDATIEFSCFDRDTGVIPNRNSIIWEVRSY